MGKTLEDLRIYQTAEELCDAVWDHVIRWDRFAKATVGKQLVHSADSIGSNINSIRRKASNAAGG